MKRRLVMVGAAALTLSAVVFVEVPRADAAAPAITVSPTSGLLDGQVLSVSGTGYAPNTVGGPVECSDAPGQPTVQVDGFAISVSCDVPSFGGSYPFNNPQIDEFSSSGTISTSFVVHTGVVGPPTLGIDSAGHSAAQDAAPYPCPPTAAQQAAGASCRLTVGDSDGNSVSTTLNFATPIAPTPAVAVVPATGLSSGDIVQVTGSGFTPGSPWLAIECNVTPGAPPGEGNTPNLPIGCAQATAVPALTTLVELVSTVTGDNFPTAVTDASGAMHTSFQIAEGNIGGSVQSAAYPCPPTAANVAAGGSCTVVVEDGAGNQATAPITITGPVPAPTITVTPSTGLIGGAIVAISGTNYLPFQLAGGLECNNAPNQPTVDYSGSAVSVSCTSPQLVSTTNTGAFQLQFRVAQGVTGPPTSGLDSAGHEASTDAAAYPCPPTPAQQSVGVICQIAVGDQSGDVARVPISFSTLPAKPPSVVTMAGTPDGSGYWLVGSDGGVFTFGDAGFHGSLGGMKLNAPIVGMATMPGGGGYWLVASDGGVFSFGDASFHGSMGGTRLNAPIVGMAPTAAGKGYWLVARDGGIFSFGNAAFFGSTGAMKLNKPIVGMAATLDSGGYRLVASDGGVFTFGDAVFEGSTGARPPAQGIRGVAASGPGPGSGLGYWLVGSAGGVYSFGGAPYLGSFPTN
jgi:hypothetical protein